MAVMKPAFRVWLEIFRIKDLENGHRSVLWRLALWFTFIWWVPCFIRGRCVNGYLNRSIDSWGSSYGWLGGLVGMTWVRSNSTGPILRLDESRQSRACDDCIIDLCERWSYHRHCHHRPCLVLSKYVEKAVSSKKMIYFLSKRDRGISYAHADASTL